MHNGDWQNGPGGDSGMWIPMLIMMVVFWAGLIALAITFIRRTHGPPNAPTSAAPTVAAKQTPAEILAERLARGEIEPDDYRQRLEALNRTPGG